VRPRATAQWQVNAVARMNPNITLAADIAALDQNVTASVQNGEAEVETTVVDDALGTPVITV
jgi:hypothetical protein